MDMKMDSTIITIDDVTYWVFYYYNDHEESFELDNISVFNDSTNQDIGGSLSSNTLNIMLNAVEIKER